MSTVTRQPSDSAEQLDRGREAFAAAVLARNATAAAGSYADDATVVAPAGDVIRGRDRIEAFWRTGVQLGIERVAFTVLDLTISGDVAFEIGEYALHQVHEDGRREVRGGRYLVVHRAGFDGGWRRAAEMFSPDRPPGPEA